MTGKRRIWEGSVRERSLVLPAMALWVAAASAIALFVARPTQVICSHGIGGSLTDPHHWDAYCAGVQAEYEASLTLADRLMQLPWAMVILIAVGWLAIAALAFVSGSTRGAAQSDASAT